MTTRVTRRGVIVLSTIAPFVAGGAMAVAGAMGLEPPAKSAPAAQAPAPGPAEPTATATAPPIDIDRADLAGMGLALIERSLPPAGRDPAAKNGYDDLLAAAATYARLSKQLQEALVPEEPSWRPQPYWLGDDLTPPRDKEEAEWYQFEISAAEQLLDLVDASDIPARLAAAASTDRFIRPWPGTPERRQQLDDAKLGEKRRRGEELEPLPEREPLLRLTALQWQVLRRAAERGDWPIVIRSVDQSLVIGAASMHQGNEVGRTEAPVVIRGTIKKLHEMMIKHTVPESTLEALERVLSRRTDHLPGLGFAEEQSRLRTLTAFRWMFTPDGWLDEAALRAAWADLPVLERLGVRRGGTRRAAAVTMLEEAMARRREVLAEPLARRRDALRAFENWSIAQLMKSTGRLILSDLHNSMVFSLSLDIEEARVLELLGMRVTIAVERFERRTGRLPDTLAEVVQAGLLPAIPVDAVNGQPLGYRTLPVPDSFRRRYLIWGFGADEQDDGGVDYDVAQPRRWTRNERDRQVGTDRVLNRP